MACPSCGNTVLFGGIKEGKRRYCSKKCYEVDSINRLTDAIPDYLAEAEAQKIHRAPCPRCKGEGPVELHKSHSIYSVLIHTKWKTDAYLLCRSCATKQQLTDLTGSFLFGWWGLPYGVLMTPVIIFKNVVALMQNPGVSGPSRALIQYAKVMMAKKQA